MAPTPTSSRLHDNARHAGQGEWHASSALLAGTGAAPAEWQPTLGMRRTLHCQKTNNPSSNVGHMAIGLFYPT
eukprot:15476516-Alexandrium_andersonii.AAC.2